MSGNGVDLAQIVSMLRDVIEAQQVMRTELRGVTESQQVMRAELRDMRAELRDMRMEMTDFRTELRNQGRRIDDVVQQMSELRKEVAMYHGSVMGHGIQISELDTRLRRVEEHLNLSPAT